MKARKQFKVSLILTIILAWILMSFPVLTVRAQQPYSMPSTAQVPFYMQYARIDGSLWYQKPIVVQGTSALTLSNSQSGSLIIQNVVNPGLITLPTPVVQGVNFTVGFAATTTATTASITSGAATDYLAGAVVVGATTSGTFNCNGTSHTSIKMNGSTTGAVIGTTVNFIGLTGGVWEVSGPIVGSGTAATPCSTTP